MIFLMSSTRRKGVMMYSPSVYGVISYAMRVEIVTASASASSRSLPA